MNKDRFHNALALKLGYERIVNDKRIAIKIDDATIDPVVTLTSDVGQQSFRFNVSEDTDVVYVKMQKALGAILEEQDLKAIIDVVHQAYVEANSQIF